jgi:glycosyltransferase involved in cell wall biosynthesis
MKPSQHKYKATVIIPTYNRCELLDYTLNSLSLQNLPKSEFEVVVADDGSTDNTLEIIEKYQSKLSLKYEFQEDLGYRPGSARNMGIIASEGEVCIFIDSGVIINTNCVQEHIRFHEEKGNISAIGYIYGIYPGDGLLGMLKKLISPFSPFESINKLAKNKLFVDVRDYQYNTYQDQIQDLPAPWFYFWTCHVSVKRENLIKVGMFDESYNGRWGCEDNDLGFRLQQDGIKIHLLRTAEAIHFPHYENLAEKKRQGYLNCIYFNNKFQTPETQMFLDTYRNELFTDINARRIYGKLRELV